MDTGGVVDVESVVEATTVEVVVVVVVMTRHVKN